MNNIRTFLIKSLAVLVLLLVASTAFAASGDTINIGGTVPLVMDLVVTPDVAVDYLPLDTADAAAQENVATITVDSNASAGWDLIIYSANNGSLLNSDGDAITYTLTYSSLESTPLNAGTAPTTAGVSYAEETDTSGDSAGTLVMDYTESTAYPAGYYSDQLTLVLRAK